MVKYIFINQLLCSNRQLGGSLVWHAVRWGDRKDVTTTGTCLHASALYIIPDTSSSILVLQGGTDGSDHQYRMVIENSMTGHGASQACSIAQQILTPSSPTHNLQNMKSLPSRGNGSTSLSTCRYAAVGVPVVNTRAQYTCTHKRTPFTAAIRDCAWHVALCTSCTCQ